MGFLSGSMSFSRFWVANDPTPPFGVEHLETMKQFVIGALELESLDQPSVGFLAGDHLLDLNFDLAKNLIGEALHFSARIDVNQIPGAIRSAWMKMELAALGAENESGRPTKAQRAEAKEAVDARCQEEVKDGRYLRMQQVPLLWDAQDAMIYIGSSSSGAIEHSAGLLERAFDLELVRVTSGNLAAAFAEENKLLPALDDLVPTTFHAADALPEVTWWNHEAGNYDYLGNEFLLWLWWQFEQSDTISLPDDSEVSGMFARSLSLECPLGESGKETISADSPVHLPEALQGIRSGKLPRKAGLTLVREGEQYDLTIQAETLSIGGARIQREVQSEGSDYREERIDSTRALCETVDLLYTQFCQLRLDKSWQTEVKNIRKWLSR